MKTENTGSLNAQPRIEVPKETEAQLVTASKQLQKVLQSESKDAQRVSDLEQKTEQLRDSIEESEADFDPLDESAVESLAKKKTQLAACERKLAELEPGSSEAPRELRPLLSSACDLIRAALQPEMQRLVAEVAASLAPLYWSSDPGRAKQAALQTDKVQSFGHFLRFDFVMYCRPDEARRVVEIIGELLEGRNPWKWNA